MKEWKNYKLNELVDYRNGLWVGKNPPFVTAKVIRVTEFNNDGTHNLETARELKVESKKLKERVIKPNQILLERSGGGEKKPVGRVILFKDNIKDSTYSFSNFTTLLIPNESVVNPRFLFYYLHFFYISGQTNHYQKAMIGIRNLEFKRYLEQDIPIPLESSQPDLEEQKRIADKIDKLFVEIDRGIIDTKVFLLDSRKIFQSKLKKIFDAELSKNWRIKKLEELAANTAYPIGDGDHGQIKPSSYRNDGIPYVRAADIGWGEFTPNGMVYISEETHKNNLKSELNPGDILIVKTGATIGKCCIVPNDIKKANTTASVGKITVNKDKVLPRWVLLRFLSPSFLKFIWSISHKAAQPSFNNRDIKLFEIPLPFKNNRPDLDEQKKIIIRLDKIQEQAKKLEEKYQEQLNNFSKLKQSILQQAFEGKLVTAKEQAPEKISIFPIQQAVGAILQRFERGEMVVAKILYLAQTINKVSFSIPFTPQNFGPYDKAVKRAVTAGLSRNNNFFSKKKYSKGFVYGLSQGSEKLFNYSNAKTLREMNKFLDEMMPYFKRVKSADIERLASACEIIKNNKTINNEEVYKELSKWKPEKFTAQEVDRSLNFIKSKGWDKILMK